MKKITGIILIFFSLIFIFIESKHFGYNLLPESYIELVCDIFGLIVYFTGMFLYMKKTPTKKTWIEELSFFKKGFQPNDKLNTFDPFNELWKDENNKYWDSYLNKGHKA